MIKINKKIIISWILVIIWASFIFTMSSMDTNKSNNKSKEVINEVIEKSVETTNDLSITNKQPSEKKKEKVIDELNLPLRKAAHAAEYLVLTILLIIAITQGGISGKKVWLYALLICFIYACTDEYHQTFVAGRTGQFTDSLIDTAGGAIGCLMVTGMKMFQRMKNQMRGKQQKEE